MKKLSALGALTLILLVCMVSGCTENPFTTLDLMQGPEYVGEYLKETDVRRIGHALDTAATRMPVKWENRDTGYQFSMMIFATDSAKGTTTRIFTILTIDQDSQGETLDLKGTSSTKNEWRIVAEAPASSIGAVGRMVMDDSPAPKASSSSGQNFKGFMVEQ